MKIDRVIRWDTRVDAAYISVSDRKPKYCREVRPGILLNYSSSDGLIGVEVLDFAQRTRLLAKGADQHDGRAKPFHFDPEADAFGMHWSRNKYSESEEIRFDVVVDFDRAGEPIGLELLHFSKRFQSPAAFRSFMARVGDRGGLRGAEIKTRRRQSDVARPVTG